MSMVSDEYLKEMEERMKDPDVFLGYCKSHSQTPRALFHIKDVNRLCEMAGLPTYERVGNTNLYEKTNGSGERIGKFRPIYYSEMEEVLELIDKKKHRKAIEDTLN